MRTPGAPVWMETISAMGATPTPLSWTEVYTGLQQDVIDAAEAQHPGTYNARLYEVISDITLTGHINLITGLVGSAKWFDALPETLQHILVESALSAGDYASHMTEEQLVDVEAKFREQGVVIHEIDTGPFVEATRGVYDKLGYTELREQVDVILDQ
jgi:TRAP-type C4-dicarboxylate transport system substrate-binding protein